MKLRYIMILSIIIKIIIGMSGVIFFLRISGKTQMAQLTPLDSVNAFVLGALIGGVIYNPDLSVWYMIFALGTWTIVNMTIRYLLRFSLIRRLVKGDTVMIVRNGQINLKEFKRNGLEMEQFRTMLREVGYILDVRCRRCPLRDKRQAHRFTETKYFRILSFCQ